VETIAETVMPPTAAAATSDTAAAAVASSSDADDGCWIGLDWGTSNGAASVYARERGRAKWLRLPVIAFRRDNNKAGRLVPSVALFATHEDVVREKQKKLKGPSREDDYATISGWRDVRALFPHNQNALHVCIGAPAVLFDKEDEDPAAVQAARVSSLKRRLLVGQEGQAEEDSITLTPLGLDHAIELDAVAVVACFLQALRLASDAYLQSAIPKKGLRVPGGEDTSIPKVRHVCLGVPAHATVHYRQLLRRAAVLAGFSKTVTTVTESTAAAVAYGLFVGTSQKARAKTILVWDMGGGTTDVTIAESRGGEDTADEEGGFRVVLTAGNNQLGGDDMDQCVLDLVLSKLKQSQLDTTTTTAPSSLSFGSAPHQRAQLLQQCRTAKEQLCGDDSTAVVVESATVTVEGARVTVTQSEFQTALQPVLAAARRVVQTALEQYANDKRRRQTAKDNDYKNDDANTTATNNIHEVILIGGASRVPAVRQLLAEMFPDLELCTSVNAHSAVAEGCAVLAALESGRVPRHELESALMLDTNPHAIGVLCDNGSSKNFVEILPANATLPARGSATFYLADFHQPGVTVQAVERVNDDSNEKHSSSYIPLGEFTFLLHRCDKKLTTTPGSRSVDIGMVLKTSGEFVVSIFDPLDPEHVRKRERYRQRKAANAADNNQQDDTDNNYRTLAFSNGNATYDSISSKQQTLLIVACVALFVLYVAVKLGFADEEKILLDASKS